MSIDLKLFESYIALCEEKSFSRAAERLKISAPTLTYQIQTLEKKLGVRLLTRKTKMAVELTEAGARFCESARDVLHQAAQAELNARQAARGEIGRVNLGYVVSAAWCGILPTLVGDFHKQKPGINIDLRAMVSASIVDGIAQHRLDVGLITEPTKYPPGIDGFVVFDQPCILAVYSQHPLAKDKIPVEPRLLREESFVVATVESELGFKRLSDAVAELGHFIPKVSKRAPEMSSILNYVSAGFGIAVVPQAMSAVRIPNLAFREFAGADKFRFPLVFAYRVNEPSAVARTLVEFMSRFKIRS